MNIGTMKNAKGVESALHILHSPYFISGRRNLFDSLASTRITDFFNSLAPILLLLYQAKGRVLKMVFSPSPCTRGEGRREGPACT
jgi:hypothetical protein